MRNNGTCDEGDDEVVFVMLWHHGDCACVPVFMIYAVYHRLALVSTGNVLSVYLSEVASDSDFQLGKLNQSLSHGTPLRDLALCRMPNEFFTCKPPHEGCEDGCVPIDRFAKPKFKFSEVRRIVYNYYRVRVEVASYQLQLQACIELIRLLLVS